MYYASAHKYIWQLKISISKHVPVVSAWERWLEQSMALLRGTTALSPVSLLQLDTIKLLFSTPFFVSQVYWACYCLFSTTTPFPSAQSHSSTRYSSGLHLSFSYDKLFTVVYSHLLCLSTSWNWGGSFSSSPPSHSHGVSPWELAPCRGGKSQKTSGRLVLCDNIANSPVTTDLFYSTLHRGGPSKSNRKLLLLLFNVVTRSTNR